MVYWWLNKNDQRQILWIPPEFCTYLGEDIFHRHEEPLSGVKAEFVEFVVSAGEHASDVGEKHRAVLTAADVPHTHRVT